MTNLLIAYPGIPKSGSLSTSVAADSDYPLVNLISGPRGAHFEFSDALTESWVGSSLSPSTAPSEYLIVARADLLQKQGATGVLLKRSTDNVSYTSHLGYATGFSGATLVGRRSEDFVSTNTFQNPVANYSASSFAYWRLYTSSSSALAYTYSKWYCGSWFDFGRDPISPYETTAEIDSGKGRDCRSVIALTWRGVTLAKADEFLDMMSRGDTEPLFLYTADYHDLLHGLRLLHVRPRQWNRTFTAQNTCEVSAMFEELV